MGWGLNIPVYLSRVTKENLPYVSSEEHITIEHIKRELLVLIASTPHTEADGEPWHEYIARTFPILMDELEDSIIRRFLCEAALENIDDIRTE